MNADAQNRNDRLIDTLTNILGKDAVLTEEADRDYFSCDVYAAGERCAAAIKPKDVASLSKAVAATTAAGYAVIGRGGGMSYTRGYTPVREDTVTVDVGAMNKIVEISEDDMYITVEAGVTWLQIYEALKPKGLRLPFFGTFSGAKATVGGGLSQGALFMGTARYGQGCDIVLGLEIVLADGSVVTTGQGGFKNARPFYRTYGPDLTGLFVHDGGAFGIKTKATLKIIRAPKYQDYASFAFKGIEAASRALSDIARAQIAEEAYIFDPESTDKNLASADIVKDIKTLANVVKGQSSWSKGLLDGAKLILAGRSFAKDGMFSLHMVAAGRCAEAVEHDLAAAREIAARHSGEEIPNSIPKAVRATPFASVIAVLGAKGDRWAALNSKVPHSEAMKIISAGDRIFARYKERMDKHGIWTSRLFIAIDSYAFSYEPVLHWNDEWLPVHRRTLPPEELKKYKEPPADPAARALVEEIRGEFTKMFAEHGASSNQIGKTYPYLDSLKPETRKLVDGLKSMLDPKGALNPGVLGFK
ncbi:MAG: FAD-binding oxidoreductase [Rhodobacteraceae bacterium]|nr:FAD-binding oxidoreductase [Paracoccaceae bacterium]